MISPAPDIDLEVFRRYAGLSLPRHVSYPMPSWWEAMNGADAASMFERSRAKDEPNELSIYVHIPFCQTLCKFCACNKVILHKDWVGASDRTEAYVAALIADVRRTADAIGAERPVRQIHWGGGTPTYLSSDQMQRIAETIRDAFDIDPDAEIAIEVDPRTTTPDKFRHLRELGFNRISLGVQDFDARVQEHVRRVQPLEMVRDTVAVCREVGFDSVNFDLIYGLPYQTVETVREAIERTIELSPNRIAFYHYAQIPDKIATQRGIDHTRLPGSEEKLEMFLYALQRFESAGYRFIGLDHFARPDERLADAERDGTIQRNFQGMTTGGGLELLGVGNSSISHLYETGFLQNERDVESYVARIRSGESPVVRGKRFTRDDLIRQSVMNQLYCSSFISPAPIERRFGVKFAEYFSREIGIMAELESDGLVTLEADGCIRATCPMGRVLMRNVAAVFDAYLAEDAYRCGEKNSFSANA